MTIREMGRVTGVVYCTGGCGISGRRHSRGIVDGFGIVHYAERRFNRRSARRFLMLCAEAERRSEDSLFLNSPEFDFWYVYHDSVRATEWARQLGFRLPARLSSVDRLYCLALANRRHVHLARDFPAVYAWVRAA